MKTIQLRQGDVWIESIESLPKGLKKKADNIIVYSDVTGHSHTLKSGNVYSDKKGNLYLEALKKTQVVHTEDHDPIDLPKGVYKIIHQVEYVMENMTKVVVD